MITQRDMEIVNYLERYDFATLKQIQKIFFRHQQYSYHLARKRLLQMQIILLSPKEIWLQIEMFISLRKIK
jgi:hypothetical protein